MGDGHAACAKRCIERGGDVVLIMGDPGAMTMLVLAPNPDDDSVYASLGDHAGHMMDVTGYESQDDEGHTIFVVTAAAMSATD